MFSTFRQHKKGLRKKTVNGATNLAFEGTKKDEVSLEEPRSALTITLVKEGTAELNHNGHVSEMITLEGEHYTVGNITGISDRSGGDFLLTDFTNGRVLELSRPNGKQDGRVVVTRKISEPNVWNAVHLNNKDIIVSKRDTPKLAMLRDDDEEELQDINVSFTDPCGLAKVSETEIVVTDSSLNSVTLIDLETSESTLRVNGKDGTKMPQFVAYEEERKMIAVSNTGSHCVQLFSQTGEHLATLGGRGDMKFPYGLSMFGSLLAACDRFNERLQIWDTRKMKLVGRLEFSEPKKPMTVLITDEAMLLSAGKMKGNHLYCICSPHQTLLQN